MDNVGHTACTMAVAIDMSMGNVCFWVRVYCLTNELYLLYTFRMGGYDFIPPDRNYFLLQFIQCNARRSRRAIHRWLQPTTPVRSSQIDGT